MSLSALAFLNPWLLLALASLPLIYWLLKTVPPRPRQIAFPPTRILTELENREKTPAKTPWWLLLLRLMAAALVIFALAGPIYDPSKQQALDGNGPVTLVVDNSWASAHHWADRTKMIERYIAQAEAAKRPVIVAPTVLTATEDQLKLMSPNEARTAARALKPEPLPPQYDSALVRLRQALANTTDGGGTSPSIVWMHDGIQHGKTSTRFALELAKLAQNGSFTTLEIADNKQPLGIVGSVGENGKLQATVLTTGGDSQSGTAVALSTRGERLAETAYTLKHGETKITLDFDLPLELRNQVARIAVQGQKSAGGVHLLDGRSHWQRIGLISGGDQEQAQPILSPLYYVDRALKPYAEIVRSKNANLAEGIDDLLSQNVTLLVLTDIGRLTEGVREQVTAWLNRGGVMIRFAGPRLEKGGDDLLPSPLRIGGRTLGGALSWSTPQPLAPFDRQSLFHGLEPQSDVTVSRQVLADPARISADVKILARLKDGTPLVTARPVGQGQVILFHVTANSDWSNLPLSGLFVEMMRRITTLGTLSAAANTATATTESQPIRDEDAQRNSAAAETLAPVETLDGFGVLRAPPPNAEAIDAAKLNSAEPTPAHPPGYYGPPAAPRALNVLSQSSKLERLDISAAKSDVRSYENRAVVSLKPWVLLSALALLFADCLAVLFLQTGDIRPARIPGGAQTTASSVALIVSITVVAGLISWQPANAQLAPQPPLQQTQPTSPDEIGRLATSKVTFGYVLTGDSKTDAVSKQGLEGLVRVLTVRTAVEPGAPLGVNIENDEIAFYPLLYWPVLGEPKPLKPKTLAKIDAFMKQGGMIIFDTRDYGSGLPTGVPLAGEGGTALQRLLGRLDVPRVEPVPEDHVLTKSFYLLNSFPGRWDGGTLWVEAEGNKTAGDERKARRADGVTSILITSNDFASAWALDNRGRGLYPTVPGGEEQREMAFRTGVNIVMHALTGNYKADQVHVPSLLERLGQ